MNSRSRWQIASSILWLAMKVAIVILLAGAGGTSFIYQNF